MDKTGWLVCNAFLNKKGGDQKKALLSYLPASQKTTLEQLHTPFKEILSGFQDSSSFLERIHFSWFSAFLRSLPESEIRLFLSCLSDSQAKKLKKSLLFSPSLLELSPLAKDYLQKLLAAHLMPKDLDLLPVEALPESKMNILLSLSLEEFQILIEFLGIHDLAVEIRQIIDTVKLKKIHACLSKEKELFLKSLTHKKESVVFKPMDLQKWSGQSETLLALLNRRGLNRLAKALYSEDPNLIWHIQHQMDEEQAALLSSLCTPLDHPKAVQLLTGQILEILSYMQKFKMK